MVSAALDFWTVKNITGRLLIGLRWWSAAELLPEDFEDSEDEDHDLNIHPKIDEKKLKEDHQAALNISIHQKPEIHISAEGHEVETLTNGKKKKVNFKNDVEGGSFSDSDEESQDYDSTDGIQGEFESENVEDDDEDDVGDEWYFESYDYNFEKSRIDTHVFWWGQVSNTIFWAIFFSVKVMGFSLFWV